LRGDSGHQRGICSVRALRAWSSSTRGDIVITTDPTLDEQSVRLGGRIRELRRARALTLAQLAERSDLSHPFLSQLERGLARPSIGSLERIVRALGSSQLELFAAIDDSAPDQAVLDQPSTVLVRAEEGTRGTYSLGIGRMLTHGSRRFTPLEFTGTTAEFGEYVVHVEDEFLFVVEGTVIVDLHGRPAERLAPGDSFYFEGGIGHRWASADGLDYRMLIIKEGRRA
jgi:transcriptional regulator with XRE-family HTH domain